jgi:hypothetical protein
MKQLFLAALAIAGLAMKVQAAPLYGYVQITTTTALTPTLQNGAINIASGTIRNVNVTFGVSAATLTASGLITGGTFSGSGASLTNIPAANITGAIPTASLSNVQNTTNTWTAPQTFSRTITISSNVVDGSSSQGSAGQSLQSNAGSAPTWVNVPSAILSTTSTWTANQTITSATVTTLNSTTINVTTITPAGIVGTTTNSNANAGNYGEYISTKTASATNCPSTGVFGDLVSFTLTAGDWDISSNFVYNNNGATTTGGSLTMGISTTSGNSSSGLVSGDNRGDYATAPITGSSNFVSGSIPAWRQSISGSTTFYFKMACSYSVATPTIQGRMSARRVR